MAARGLPGVVESFGLLHQDPVYVLLAGDGVLGIVDDLGHHRSGIQGQTPRIDETVEIEILEAQAQSPFLRDRHEESDRIAGGHQGIPHRSEALLELRHLFGIAVFVQHIVEGVGADGHHLHVPAIRIEKRRSDRFPTEPVQVGIDYAYYHPVSASDAHLLDDALHVLTGMRDEDLRLVPIDEFPEHPGIRHTLHEEIGSAVDGAFHRYLVANVLIRQKIAHRRTSALWRSPICRG